VDDTFVIWPHGLDKLKDSLNLLNVIRQVIPFTMEPELRDTTASLTRIITGESTVLWAIGCTVYLALLTSNLTLDPTTTYLTNKLYFPH
jgi:hypothetical protein